MTTSDHQLRIAILMPDMRGGGAERVAANLANGFVQRGYAVDMVLLSATGDFLTDLHPNVKVVDLQVDRMRWALVPLIKYLRHFRPAAVLACMWPLTIAAVVARALSRVSTRLVVAEHTTWSKDDLLKRPTVEWQIRTSMHWVFPSADGVVAVSQGAADDLAQFARLDIKKITTIYNPVVGDVRIATLSPFSPSGWWMGPHHKLLAVGALKDIKDYATLLNAFALLRKRVNVRLLILGEGKCRTALEAQVQQLGMEASVFMPGYVKDIFPYYQQADLHVLSSTGEGFGNVIVEALAARTPVVSTDCMSGPREILADGKFGALVPVGDVAALALAMEAALLSEHDHDALRARAGDFSIDKAVDQYELLLFPVSAKLSR